jgi:MFS family permease
VVLPSKHLHANKHAWLGWAVFLGVSWTWCIGMFLPVLLVHDYGVWAWLVFAIPNVVGAAAMGWLIDAQTSRSMLIAHRAAITAFSVVTVAFQIFFAVWAFTRPPWQAAGYAWYLVGFALIAIVATLRKSSKLLAFLILLASIACVVFHHGEARLSAMGAQRVLSTAPSPSLRWLAPVCLFGFLLCPYLDSTFHRARQHLDETNAKWAFGVGFGVIFFAAIILSLLYARQVHFSIASPLSSGYFLRWLKVYWMLQLGFTVGVHLIGDDEYPQPRSRAILIAILGIIGAIVALAIGAGLKLKGEVVYRGFLGFYALVFPAYIWLCVLPGRFVRAPSRWALNVFAFATLVATPMFWLAFINKELVWAAPGVAIVVLARLFVTGSLTNALKGLDVIDDDVQQNSAPTS